MARSISSLARLALRQHDQTRAKELFQESLELRQQLGYIQGIAASLAGLAGLAGSMGHPQRATRLFGTAKRLLEETGATLPPQAHEYYVQHLEATRSQLDESTFADSWAQGQSLSLEQAISEALAI